MTGSVLLCGISSGDVTIHFASSILRMQTELVRTQKVNVNFEFFQTVNDALTYFHQKTTCDVCVVIDGQMSVEPGFILQHDMSKPVVVASYPLRMVDWDRVRAKLVDSDEPPSHVGIRYNYDPAIATPEPGGAYLKLEQNAEVQLKIFKITRAALDSIIARHGNEVQSAEKELVIYSEGVIDDHKVTADQRFVRLWGEPLYADVTHHTKNVGPFDFTGVVGNQKQLR